MNIQRLTTLAAMLASVPPAKFSLHSWRALGGNDEIDKSLTDAKLLDAECGTVGCAVGWACAMPEFNEQGLSWWSVMPGYTEPGSDNLTALGWDAVYEFFGLSRFDAHFLFDIQDYDTENPTPAEVAERINCLVANLKARPGHFEQSCSETSLSQAPTCVGEIDAKQRDAAT